MAGPRLAPSFFTNEAPEKTLLAALMLASAGCSFDAKGLGQSGDPGETSQSSGGPQSAASSTGEPAPTTGTDATTAGPAGEASATGETGSTGSTGPVDPMTSTTGDPPTPAPSTGSESTDGETSSSSGSCVEKPYYLDADMDGFGETDELVMACAPPGGYVEKPDDCDDTNPAVNPGAEEVCLGGDDDCDGHVDEYNPPTNVECGCRMALYNVNNRVYHFCTAPRKWNDAKGDCEEREATLAEDLDDAHHAWLLMQVGDNTGPWLTGGNAANKDDMFTWLDGDPISDDDPRWGFGQPVGIGNTNKLALVSNNNVGFWSGLSGKWVDRGENDAEPFICEGEFFP